MIAGGLYYFDLNAIYTIEIVNSAFNLMPARVTRTSHKLGYREVVYNVKKQKFYTDKDGDQFEQIAIPGVTDSVTQEDIDNSIANIDAVTQTELDAAVADKATNADVTAAVADKVTQAEIDAAVADKVTQTEIDAAVADKVTQTEIDAAVADKVTQAEIDAAVADKVTQAEIDAAVADKVTQAEIDAAVADKVTDTELNTAVSDKVTQAQVDASITAAADSIVPLATANSQGYFFQNSHYFSDGLSHATNPDVVTDVPADTETIVKFSDTTAGESGGYLQESLQGSTAMDITHMYDRTTGVITLKGLEAAQFILVRVQIDLEPDSDNSSANICLRCTANGASGGFTFDIEEQLASLDQGAEKEYPTNISIPVFVGSTLSEDPSGSPATITPIVKFTNTSGDIKPRALAIFFWS